MVIVKAKVRRESGRRRRTSRSDLTVPKERLNVPVNFKYHLYSIAVLADINTIKNGINFRKDDTKDEETKAWIRKDIIEGRYGTKRNYTSVCIDGDVTLDEIKDMWTVVTKRTKDHGHPQFYPSTQDLVNIGMKNFSLTVIDGPKRLVFLKETLELGVMELCPV